MGRTFSFSLDISGHHVRDISLTWGLRPVSDIREQAATYGTDIEVPAVIELLDLIVSGVASAEEVRDLLGQVATQINEEQDREYEDRQQAQERSYAKGRPVPAVRPDSRWVYAMSSEDEPNVIKIGVARNVRSRMKGIQTGSAFPIALLWSTRGGKPLEDHLHETFRRRRLTGEWFDFRRVSNPVKLISDAASAFLADYELVE